ncbi:MAG: DUF3883 domain-containing protein [Candidatus Nitrosocaldus sp.]
MRSSRRLAKKAQKRERVTVQPKEHLMDTWVKATLTIKNYLGGLITEDEFTALYEELRRLPKDQWDARLKASIDKITENRLITLERINGLITGYKLDRTRLESMKKILKYGVDSNEIKRFVDVFLKRYGGNITQIGSLYQIFMPTSIIYSCKNMDIGGIINGSFDQSIAESKNYTYLALGNKHIMLMLNHAARDSVTISTFDSNLNGIIFTYMLSIIDGRYRPINGKVVSILCKEGSDDVMEIDSRAIWDLGILDEKGILQATRLTTQNILELKEKADKSVHRIMDELINETTKKLDIIKERTIDAIENYYANEMIKVDKKIQEYKERLIEAPYYAGLKKIEENKREKLKREYEKVKKEKENEFKVYLTIELIGIAQIIADKKEREEEGREEEKIDKAYSSNERIKELVELNGMKIAIEYEKSRAGNDPNKLSSIKDVSNKYAGYDIESFDRVIEVKAFKDTGSIQLTSHEWLTMMKLGDEYYIYAIEDALGKGRLIEIQNPAKKFANKVKPIQIIDYKYVIDDWKDKCV